jgi:hypothetical protein
MSLYNVAGRRVASRAAERYGPGSHLVSWDPVVAGAGVYFMRVESDLAPATTRRWIVVR